jgi:hypothetical protein
MAESVIASKSVVVDDEFDDDDDDDDNECLIRESVVEAPAAEEVYELGKVEEDEDNEVEPTPEDENC